MTVHQIEVPERLRPPACSCGWTPPLPWPVTWDRWDADAEAHLAEVTEQAHADEVARRHHNQHTREAIRG